MPSIFITAMKKFDMNWGSWSNRIRSGGSQADTYASMMADATDMAVIRRMAEHLVSLAKRSVITKMKRLPFLEAGMGPRRSTGSSVRSSVAGNSVKGVLCRRKARRFWAQVVHRVMVVWMSVTIEGQ